MEFSPAGFTLLYIVVGLSAVVFLVWLGAQIVKLLRAPDEPPAPPAD